MGNPRGFLEIERREPGYRPVNDRIKDFNEVEKHFSVAELEEQAARCMECGVPFCHSNGCPLENLIPEWNDLVYKGQWEKALQILCSTSNFPEFTGRICPQLCEVSCTCGIDERDPVSIRQIEVSLIEKGFENGWIKPQPPKRRTEKKVAVIGSGPAGLAIADLLNKIGHSVTVYEKDNKLGGFMRYGIPDFKLDKQIIDRRIKFMEDEGIVFEADVNVGIDLSSKYLRNNFDAIALACGAREPRNLPVLGRDLKGVYYAMEYLEQSNKNVSKEEYTQEKIDAKNKNVVVIGGGDTGSDCVGTANRQGAKSVTQIEIMPKPPITRHEGTPWPEWPYQLRTSSSHKEGCKRFWNIKTANFAGKENIEKINAVKVEWEVAPNGRPLSMKDIENSEFAINADLVFLAMGFTGPEKAGLLEDLKLDFDKRGNVVTKDDFSTNIEGVFAAGDIASGPSLVVRAIAAGRKVADTINKYLK